MITEREAVALMSEANPVPDLHAYDVAHVEVTTYLKTLEQRGDEMIQTDTKTDVRPERGRRKWWIAAAAAAIAVVIAIGLGTANDADEVPPADDVLPVPTPTTVPTDDLPVTNTGFPADLTGFYAGSAIYEEEDGSPHDRLLWVLELSDDNGALTGYLSHAEARSASFDLGRDLMPVEVERTGDTISVRWDESVGAREDTTVMQCDVTEISFTAAIAENPDRIEITDGRWIVTGDEPSPFDETCHNHGIPIFVRGVLRQTDNPAAAPE